MPWLCSRGACVFPYSDPSLLFSLPLSLSVRAVLCYGMDGAQLDEYEVRLKEVFDGFDGSGSGSLCQEELSDLCQALHLEEAATALLRELVQEGSPSDRVHFEQFKDALILVLSTTLGGHPSSEENSQEPDSSEANPKFVKDGKRYGRRSLPEFGESIEGFAEVSETEAVAPEENPQNTPPRDGCEPWKTSTQCSEEYEAEGQLRFCNPDDPGTPRGGQPPSLDWLEERLGAVCEELGVSRHGYASCRQLISMCEQLGLEGPDDVFTNLDPDRMMSVQDFVSGVLRNGKPPTPSASTPYRQLKRHLSTQPFDESGRRTATPSAMTSTIALRLFSGLDDGSGYTSAERLLDAWQEEGIDNCHEILQALDFSLDRKVNLSELTIALENELQITKNGIHQAVLASFKSEIRHLLERVDREMREKGKLRSDLDKADRLKTQMATEMDEHHSAIERLNDSNLRKLEQEYRDRLAAVKAELTRDRDQIQQQASKQRSELEREVEKVKEEELYLRDRLSLAHKENMRLEAELLEVTEKLVESENLASKLQSNLDNILQEKFGDLDPGSAEFFLQEERFKRMRSECEQQCRELQDRIDELQAELEEYSALGRTSRPSLGLSLTEEFDSKSGVGVESDPGLGLEEGHPFNMSLEAEMLVEQLKDQHQQDMASVRAELQSKVSEHEQQVEELKAGHAQEQRALEQRCREEVSRVQNHVHELQSQLETLEEERERVERLHIEERAELERRQGEEKSQAQARASELQVRVEALESERERGEEERRELERRHAEERARLEETLQERVQEERERKRAELEEREEELAELFEQERCSQEKRHLEALEDLTLKHSKERQRLTGRLQSLEQEILEERKKLEGHFNQKIREVEARFSGDQEAISERFRQDVSQLEERYQQELKDLSERHSEEKAQWEFEKEELLHEGEGERERLRETLEREKEVASQDLILERDLLEKSHKEEFTNLIAKNHQLQKDLEDLRAVAQGKEMELCELQNELQERLEAKAELLAQAEDKAQKLDLLLQQAVDDFEQERSELQSQLCSLEKKTMEAWSLVEEGTQKKQELAAEVRKLETRIQELELEALTLSEGYEEAKKQNVEMFAKVSHLTERIKELEAEAEALAGLQMESEQIEREEISSTFRIPEVEEHVPGEFKVIEGDGEMPEFAPLQKQIKRLEKENKIIPQLQGERDHAMKERDDCCTEILKLSEKLQDQGNLRVELQTRLEAAEAENLKLQERITELEEAVDTRKTSVGEQAERDSEELHLDISRVIERTKELEDKTLQVMELQSMYEECSLDKSRLREEKLKLEERVQGLEEEREQRLGDLEEECARSKTEMSTLAEENSFLRTQIRELKKQEEQLRNQHQETENSRMKEVAEVKARKEETLQELNVQLEAKIQAVSELEDSCAESERKNAELKNAVSDLQKKCHKFQEKSQAHRSEARRLAEENLSLKREISTLKEDGGFSQLKLKDLGDTQEEVLRKVEQFKKEKMAALKAAENLKKQVLELRARGQQLESENAELAEKSGRNAEDLVELNRRMCEVLRHHENRENGRRHHRGELERERAALSAELSQERSKMAACMSTLESELSRVEEKTRVLEQEKALLSQELSAMKEKLSGSSDLKKELLGVVCKNEKLQKEKEALSEELNRCVDKVAKIGVLENQLAQLRQDRQAVEQHAQTLRSQLSASLDKVHSLEEAIQSVNLQVARLKSDLRVTQQEKEALKQEVMSLHKQLQNANDKNQVLDLAVHSTGYQNQQKKLYWDELARLVEQEQQLLRQENERLQKEVQNTKGDLNHSREKIRQLEAMILTLKQQKQQGQSSLVKVVEQEKSSLKRELEQLHRELLAAKCRVSELSDCERDLESLKVENEALRSRQARLESQTLCEQLGGLVPREQLVQAQHRLLQGERRGQHRPEDLGGRVPDINVQQEGDVLLRMEERMRNVEQNLRNVKLLLQEKVSQLKDQLHRNTKADEMIKDLYVENSQLLKALEMTENRQKVTEKKNYLLEEKISSLNKIVRDLSPSPLTAVPYHFTRS
ncbi:ninein-like [Acipenser oxyrinchus oxyrinchus]|uniref:Ninein-like n=1 Tax=Acipenser oxyrinchus oxyrinchus TaxID=40147 RepID=A0AAD8D156_ACIOX|nr:ninein-like [Acipenser oxyrinchus oxyrinchus]